MIMKLKAHLTFFISILRLSHFLSIITTYIFLADGAGHSQQVGFAEHVFTVMHTRKPLNGCVTNLFFPESRAEVHVNGLLWLENHEPFPVAFR